MDSSVNWRRSHQDAGAPPGSVALKADPREIPGFPGETGHLCKAGPHFPSSMLLLFSVWLHFLPTSGPLGAKAVA